MAKSILSKRPEDSEVKALVYVAGGSDPILYKTLHLKQSYFDHHWFDIEMDHAALGKLFDNPEKQMELTGEDVIIEIHQADSGDYYSFLGVITDVKIAGADGLNGTIRLIGASRTILMERGRMLQTYSDLKLEEVLEETKKGIVLDAYCKPIFQDKVDFALQYYESDFEFVRRMASQYKEILFYSGDELIWGQSRNWETETLIYDVDLDYMELSSRLVPVAYTDYFDDHKSKERDNYEKNIHTPEYGGPDFNGIVYQQAAKMNKARKPYSPLDIGDINPGLVEMFSQQKHNSDINKLVVLKGKCKIGYVKIGRTVAIQMPDNSEVNKDLGEYKILKVSHFVDEVGHYSCEFEASKDVLNMVPFPEIRVPVAQPLEAFVTSNTDPLKLGRVQLQFPFEKKKCHYWFRTMSPENGGLKKIGKEQSRGVHFVLEEGDRALISFLQNGNPNFPFVSGSMKDGFNTKFGGEKGNHVRGIWDKANNHIEFNSGGGIMLKDKAGNFTHHDGGDFILMSANDHIKLTNGKCIIEMQGEKIWIYAPEEIAIESKTIGILASDLLEVRGKKAPTKKMIVSAQNEITVSSKDQLTVSSTNEATFGSKTANIIGEKEVNIGGTKVNINSK